MAELTISQLIKLILGILVVVAVVFAVYFVFRNKVGPFISNIPNESIKTFLILF